MILFPLGYLNSCFEKLLLLAILYIKLILFVILICFLNRMHVFIMGDLNQDIESVLSLAF